MEYHITLPSKPRIISEKGMEGVYEIDALYPGYGHTLGNSLRRIILSSLPGASITSLKIEGIPHEFATIEGMRETVIEMILNLKRVHFILHGDESQTISISVKGAAEITAKDFSAPSQVEIANPEQHIADISNKSSLELEAVIERGLGYIPRENIIKDKVDTGTIALDATFTPIRRVNYEVENMRVGNRTDFNRLRIFIETNGVITPREALEQSIEIMVYQLKAIIGFQESNPVVEEKEELKKDTESIENTEDTNENKNSTNIKIDELGIPKRAATLLSEAGIRSVAGLVRKNTATLQEIDGIGNKAIQEIKTALKKLGLSLKEQ